VGARPKTWTPKTTNNGGKEQLRRRFFGVILSVDSVGELPNLRGWTGEPAQPKGYGKKKWPAAPGFNSTLEERAGTWAMEGVGRNGCAWGWHSFVGNQLEEEGLRCETGIVKGEPTVWVNKRGLHLGPKVKSASPSRGYIENSQAKTWSNTGIAGLGQREAKG